MKPVMPRARALPALMHGRSTGSPRATRRLSGLIALLAASLFAAAPTRAQDTSQPEQATRSVEFEYHPVHGQVTLERIDPGLSTCVEKLYGHDEYGNRRRTEVRPCAHVTGAAAFTPRITVVEFDPPASQAGVQAALNNNPNTHAPGAYATRTRSVQAGTNATLSEAAAVYDTRFGTVSRQTAVAHADPQRSLNTHVVYDGFGRVEREIAANGTSVRHRRVYCLGARASVAGSADAAPCLRHETTLTVSIASGRLANPDGSTTQTARLAAITAYYIESTPYDTNDKVMGAITRVHYDSLNREIAKETQAYAPGKWVRTLKAYDQLGLSSAEWGPHFVDNAATPPPDEMRQWASRFDEIHRPVEKQHHARLENGAGTVVRTTQIAYNGLETTTRVLADSSPDGAERVARVMKNGAGQTAQTVDVYGATLNSAYDALGQLRRTVTALGAVNTLSYTPGTARFKVSMHDPNTGTWAYEYNALGELKRQVDAKQNVTTLQYDDLGRLIAKSSDSSPAGHVSALVSTWRYDRTEAGAWCAGGLNRLCESAAGGSVPTRQRIGYDALGRPQTTVTQLDREYTSSVAYSATTGALTRMTYPTGFAVDYRYSTLASGKTPGILEKLTDAADANRSFWQIDTLNAADVFSAQGQVLRARLGNGVTTHHAYDSISGKALVLRATGPNGEAVQSNTYTYDLANNLARRVDELYGLSERFQYDRLDRLTQYTVASATEPSAERTIALTYNAEGNILSKSDFGGYVYGASNGPRPHAVQSAGGVNYFYDANGQLTHTTGAQQRTHVWTPFNQPASMTHGGNRVDFIYDADYKRVQETITANGQVRTIFKIHPDNANGLGYEREEVRSGGTVLRNENRHYISVGGAVIAVVKTDNPLNSATLNGAYPGDVNKVNYWHKDPLGSIVVVTNGAGQVQERMAFDAWGRRIRPSGGNDPSLNPAHGDRGFTGHEHLDELGLVHMNGRVYDPLLGRFLSPDPYIQSPDSLQSYNRLSYVLNNPLAYTDPNGEIWWHVAAFVVGAALAHNGNKHWKIVGTFMMMWALSSPGGLVEAGLGAGSTANACIAAPNAFNAGGIGNSMLSAATATAATPGAHGENIVLAALSAGVLTEIGAAYTAGGIGPGGAVGLHALVGCAQGALSGGKCGPSALAAGFGKAATFAAGPGVGLSQFAVTTIAGGTASVIGGGKFANGAFQAGFGYLFNQAATRLSRSALIISNAAANHPSVYSQQYLDDDGRYREPAEVSRSRDRLYGPFFRHEQNEATADAIRSSRVLWGGTLFGTNSPIAMAYKAPLTNGYGEIMTGPSTIMFWTPVAPLDHGGNNVSWRPGMPGVSVITINEREKAAIPIIPAPK